MLSRYVSACVFALSLTTVAASSASADSYDLGTLTSSYTYKDVIYHEASKTKFTDIFTFSVPEHYTADITALVKSLSFLGPLFEVKKLSLTGPAGDTGSSDTFKSYSDLASGDYAFDVTGKSKGWFGGLYKFSFVASLSPVPEPATIAMLLAGLGLVVTTARRRTVNR